MAWPGNFNSTSFPVLRARQDSAPPPRESANPYLTRIPSPKTAPTQLTDDLLLTRYLPFPRFLTLLDGDVIFTPLRLLGGTNDPLENRAITDPRVLLAELESLSNSTEVVNEIISVAPEWVQRTWATRSDNVIGKAVVLSRAFHEFLGRTRAASCWFANEHESSAMWSTFAPQGVAVTTTLRGLQESLSRDREYIVAAIRYRDRSIFQIDGANHESYPHMLLRPYLLKGVEFVHEKEVRIITRCREDQTWFPVHAPNLFDAITKIAVSPYVDLDSAPKVIRYLQDLLQTKLTGRAIPAVAYSSISEPVTESRQSELEMDRLYEGIKRANGALEL